VNFGFFTLAFVLVVVFFPTFLLFATLRDAAAMYSLILIVFTLFVLASRSSLEPQWFERSTPSQPGSIIGNAMALGGEVDFSVAGAAGLFLDSVVIGEVSETLCSASG